MKIRVLLALLSLCVTLFMSVTRADDIDLYVGGAQITGVTPNVLLVLDNSSNWAAASQHWPDGGKQGVSELQSLNEVIQTLKGQNINIGLMMFGRDGGGLVRYAIRDMSDVSNVAALQTILGYMATNAVGGSDADEVASDTNYDDMMNSAFRYFNGLNRWKDTNGAAQDRRDYDGNAINTLAQPVFNPGALGNYALNGANSNPYNRPAQVADGCAKNFIIFIGNGFPQNITDGSDMTTAGALIGAVPNLTPITDISPKNPFADEWARFMYQKGVKTTIPDPNDATKLLYNKIVTYTIDVCKDACDPSQEKLLRSMAGVGGGKYFKSTSKGEIKKALEMIFAEIQAVNSMFASASLPISVNTQGTFENQVYIGMFRPDGNARPRWLGNLKEYKFARYCDANGDGLVQDGEKIADSVTDTSACPTDSLKLYLGDRNNDLASDQTTGTGFISLNATSYWTTAQTPGFWTFQSDPVAGTDDAPDGPLVERGGAAFKLRNQFVSGRNIYTCIGSCLTAGSALSSSPFDTSNSTLVTKLTPTGTKTVTLSRVGEAVTATSGSAHGFNNGDTVNIAGATPSDYNGAFQITTAGPTATTFTYSITEFPTGDTSGLAQVSSGAVTVNISSILIDESTAVATVTTAAAHGLATGDSATISNASQSFLNGSKVVTVTAATSFTYPVTLPSPVTPATVPGTSRGPDGVVRTNASVDLVGTSPRQVVVRTTANHTFSAGNSVLVAGVTPSDYNGTRTISTVGTACPGVAANEKNRAYCFNLINSPDGGSGMTMTRLSSPVTINISRPVGSTTATAVRPDGTAFTTLVGVSATIAGSTQNAYNQAWTVTLAGDSKSFTFGPVTISPAAPSGSASASSSAAVAPNSLINWVRGMDNIEDENLNASFTDVRASIHADVLHSRPLMLNFGGVKGIVGFYGSNDGLLHAIKGGITDSDGNEKWAFIPEEFLSHSKLSRLYSNQPLVRYPNLVCGITPTPQPRDYFWDGTITAYQTADASATTAPSKSWIFASMRRGGSSIYALDVTDPDAPKFKWRISNSDTDFSALQQTWSEPRVARVKGTVGGAPVTKIVLIFGSGYAASEEDKPSGSARTSLAASGVYVVDADTGARLAFIQQPSGVHKYSFTADVSLADIDADGSVDRLYAVDSGGNLFRFDADVGAAPGTTWTSYLIAQVGDVGNDGGTDARKFFFPPELLGFTDPVTKLPGMAVFVGSGDREHPLQHPITPTCPAYYGGLSSFGTAVQDGFYAVMDKVQLGASAATVNASPTLVSDLLLINADPANQVDFSLSSSYKGWYLKLSHETDAPANASDLDEEKVVNAPRIVGGVLKFATNTPRLPDKSKGICSNLGDALNYAVNPLSGHYSTVPIDGGGLPPTITAGIVMIGDKPYYAEIGGGLRPTDPTKISQPIPGSRRKVYWYYNADPQ